jgi:hypothetical protein
MREAEEEAERVRMLPSVGLIREPQPTVDLPVQPSLPVEPADEAERIKRKIDAHFVCFVCGSKEITQLVPDGNCGDHFACRDWPNCTSLSKN